MSSREQGVLKWLNGDNIMDAATREGVGGYMNYDGKFLCPGVKNVSDIDRL